MHNIKHQEGVATVLLVLLVGLGAMVMTASVARNMVSKKEASVAAHAQTNAQLMGWAGVGAFRAYLLSLGKENIDQIQALHGQTISLRSNPDQKEISAQNIQVINCTIDQTHCVVSAEISSNHLTAQAATTIQAIYHLSLNDGAVTVDDEKVAVSFTGNTSLSGTTLRAEVPNSDVVLNVDGGMSLLAGIKLQNIRQLTINATGNVLVDCGTQDCGSTKININTKGRVDLLNGGNYGVIQSEGVVSISAAYPNKTNIQTIHSASDVFLTGGSIVQQVFAVGNVTLTAGAYGGNIVSNGYVSLTTSSAQHIEAQKNVYLSGSTVKGDVKAYHYVELLANATVEGSIYAKGERTLTAGLPLEAVSVTHSASTVEGNIYAHPTVLFYGLGAVKGDVYVTRKVKGFDNVVQKKVIIENPFSALNFSIPTVNSTNIKRQIAENLEFDTKVDVRVYKSEANYIFTHNNQMSAVYLNKLYHPESGKTYIYENEKQYEITTDGTKQFVSDHGFAIGDYAYAGKQYIGALCLTSANGICRSEIIGFLPRISVGKTTGFDNDYDIAHTIPRKTWILRSTSTPSELENAAFAPGILYFEGDVSLVSHGNIQADSMTSTFTNTILAEGDIRAEAVSPRIYSPFNLLREGEDKVALICDRLYKDLDQNPLTGLNHTRPHSTSAQYLVPVNLCNISTDNFRYGMNRNQDGSSKKVIIDGTEVSKLDLGFVALMANKNVAVGTCARVYGDVYARSSVAVTASCGVTENKNSIVGNIGTQGVAPYVSGAQHMNTFTANSEIVVPRPEFTNAKNTDGSTTQQGHVVSSVTLQWSKYK